MLLSHKVVNHSIIIHSFINCEVVFHSRVNGVIFDASWEDISETKKKSIHSLIINRKSPYNFFAKKAKRVSAVQKEICF
jgi:hypothetical protein